MSDFPPVRSPRKAPFTGLMQPISLDDFYTLEDTTIAHAGNIGLVTRYHPGVFTDVPDISPLHILLRWPKDAPTDAPFVRVGLVGLRGPGTVFPRPLWVADTVCGGIVALLTPTQASPFYVPLRFWNAQDWAAHLRAVITQVVHYPYDAWPEVPIAHSREYLERWRARGAPYSASDYQEMCKNVSGVVLTDLLHDIFHDPFSPPHCYEEP